MDDDRSDVLARAIAGHGLPGVPKLEPRTVPDDVWQRAFSRIRAERITGLAVQSVVSGWLETSDEQTIELLGTHRDSMTWCLAVERKLVGLADAFDAEGVVFAVLKGPSVAHTMYADPSLRSFGDLDLLVSTVDYERACALLGRLGHVRQRPEPRPGFEVRFGKASVHKHPDDAVEVDLHRTLVLGPFGLWIDPQELLNRAALFQLGGRPIPRLDDVGILLNVAMHAALGWSTPKLVPQRDILEVMLTRELDWELLARWSKDWRLSAVLQRAFTLASSSLQVALPADAERFVRSAPPAAEVRALAAYQGERRDARGGTSIATLRAIGSVRGKAAYVRALVLPDREFLERRAAPGQRSSYVRRLAVPTSWLRRRLTSRFSGTRSES